MIDSMQDVAATDILIVDAIYNMIMFNGTLITNPIAVSLIDSFHANLSLLVIHPVNRTNLFEPAHWAC